jgi:hypothetical protein
MEMPPVSKVIALPTISRGATAARDVFFPDP